MLIWLCWLMGMPVGVCLTCGCRPVRPLRILSGTMPYATNPQFLSQPPPTISLFLNVTVLMVMYETFSKDSVVTPVLTILCTINIRTSPNLGWKVIIFRKTVMLFKYHYQRKTKGIPVMFSRCWAMSTPLDIMSLMTVLIFVRDTNSVRTINKTRSSLCSWSHHILFASYTWADLLLWNQTLLDD